MITLNFDSKSFDLRTSLDEITIKEFNKITNIIGEDDEFFSSWLDILEILGVPNDILDILDIDTLLKIIKEFNLTKSDKLTILKEIEIDGYTYRLYEGDEFKITVRISSLVEDVIKNNPNNFISVLMATLYKRIDLTNKEHTDKSHIEYKTKLFENITIDKCMILFMSLYEGIVKKIENFNQ
jgi:hypothetical protein